MNQKIAGLTTASFKAVALACLTLLFTNSAIAQNYPYASERHPLAYVPETNVSYQSSQPTQAAQAGPSRPTTPSTAAPATPPPRRVLRSGSATESTKTHGHFFTTNRFEFANLCCPLDGYAEYLTPGRFKIADQGSAEVDDRFIFNYQYFGDGLETAATSGAGTTTRRYDVNQITVGFEKVFGTCKNWSLEMRLPFYSVNDTVFTEGFSNQNPRAGNLIAIAKRRLFEDRRRTISAGLGMSLPTGNDSSFIAIDEQFTVNNDAVYLQPFIASLWRPDDCWFVHSSLAVDFAASGNRIDYRQLFAGGASNSLGELTDQSLLHVDLSVGRWWYQSKCDRGITGLASAFELHYTSTLDSGDAVSGTTPGNYFRFAPGSRHFDILDATLGLDVQFGRGAVFRTAWVVPIRSNGDRFFDNEIQASINRRF